jgi:hypothetical protein
MINFTFLISDDIYTKRLVEDDFITLYAKFLDTDIIDIKEETVWLLNNIVANNANKAVFLKTDLLGKIIHISQTCMKISLTRNLSSFFKTMSSSCEEDIDNDQVNKIFEIFSNFIYVSDETVVSDCLWGLSNLSEYSKIDMNRYIRLIDRLLSINYMNDDQKDIIAIMIIFGNLISIDNNNTLMEILYEKDFIEYLEAVLMNTRNGRSIRKVLFVISNICMSGNFMIERFLDSNLCNQVVSLIDNKNSNIRKEALWVFNNLTAGRHFSHCLTLINRGIYQQLMRVMDDEVDKDMLLKIINILDNIFNTGESLIEISGRNPLTKKFVDIGGYDILEKLLNHYSHEIFQIVGDLLKTYFKY